MTKLRLLITPECNRSCKGCCNDVWDLDTLPVISWIIGYEEVMLTGGEPMLYPLKVLDTIDKVINHPLMEKCRIPKIYLYTAKTKPPMELLMVLRRIDGMTVSLHEPYDILGFEKLQRLLKQHPELHAKELRLNVVSHIHMDEVDTTGWDVRYIEWVAPEDCPLPEGEKFARIGD